MNKPPRGDSGGRENNQAFQGSECLVGTLALCREPAKGNQRHRCGRTKRIALAENSHMPEDASFATSRGNKGLIGATRARRPARTDIDREKEAKKSRVPRASK